MVIIKRTFASSAAAPLAPVSSRWLSSTALRASAAPASGTAEYVNIKVSDAADGKVRLITLNRPKALNALNSILAYQPTVPHWGYNGNARRYWDNIYGGKVRTTHSSVKICS